MSTTPMDSNPTPEAATVQGKVTGLIYPPPDIRAIVDKTAQFVARNGRSFERKIAGETASARFAFLRPADPYHAYYQHKVNEFIEQNDKTTSPGEAGPAATDQPVAAATESVTAPTGPTAATPAAPAPPPSSDAAPSDDVTGDVVVERKAVEAVTAKVAKKMRDTTLTAPPPERFAIKHPHLGALDQEIMYLTAQYTALSGKSFLAGLATREQRNPQFDFLKPTHALFAYFTALVESYALALGREPEQMKRIEEGMERMKVLDRCVHKLEWARQEQEKKDREAAADDAERLAASQVDWHDFIVVETIAFNDEEEAAAAHAVAAGQEQDKQNASDDEDMDMEDDDDDNVPKPQIKVVENYVPLAHTQPTVPAQPLLSVDGKTIPSTEANEHMRILLMNPKWREETQRHLEKQKESSYAAGAAIADSLKRFATKRADIFSTSANEAVRVESAQESSVPITEQLETTRSEDLNVTPEGLRPPPSVTSSAVSGAIGAPGFIPGATAPFPGPIASGGAPGMPPPFTGPPGVVLPAPMMFPGQGPPPTLFPPRTGPPGLPPPQGPPFGVPPGFAVPNNTSAPLPVAVEGEPVAKRQRTEGNTLLTEDEFAALHPGNVRLSIKVPHDPENAQWNLNGQTINIEIDVRDTMRTLKERLTAELGGMPLNKQQLKGTVGFLKDSLTCAHYNFVNGTALEFSVRQRGGRR